MDSPLAVLCDHQEETLDVLKMNQSAIWGGATLGLIVGLIAGIFREVFWLTVIYGVLIGVGVGILATILGWVSDTVRRRSN